MKIRLLGVGGCLRGWVQRFHRRLLDAAENRLRRTRERWVREAVAERGVLGVRVVWAVEVLAAEAVLGEGAR